MSRQDPLHELIKQTLDGDLSRRGFGKALLSLGFSTAAASSLTAMVTEADAQTLEEDFPRQGKTVTGTGAEIFIETLEAAGVEYLFATTATGMTSLFDAMAVRKQVKFVLALTEAQATAMAHGYELASGKTAALFLPGVAIPSAMNNLYNAWKDRSSIAVFSDAQSTDFRGRNQFQQMDDWVEPMRTFTKWAWEINNPKRISEFTRRAIKMAGTPPGGPVYIRYPLNLLAKANIRQKVYPQSLFKINLNLPPRPELVEATAKALLSAKQPYFNVGHEVTRAGAVQDVIELAELIGAKVSQGYSVYGDFPFNHELWGDFYGLGVPKGLAGSDVFFNIGSEMPSPAIITSKPPSRAKIIHARMEYEDIGNIQPTDIAIAGGIKETITAVIAAIKSMASEQELTALATPRLTKAKDDFKARKAKALNDAQPNWNNAPMSWERIGFELDQHLAEDAIIVSELDSRIPYRWLDFSMGKKRLIGQTTGFALGWSVPAALGVKVAEPNKQVVCLLGDGAFLFGQTESLWMAARHDIPITIVLFDNESYDGERERIWQFSPLAKDKERRDEWKDMSCYLGDPVIDYVKVSEGFGVPAEKVVNPKDMKAAMKRAAKANRDGKAYFIDAKIMQKGHGANDNWHPDIAIADKRSRKV